MSLKKDHAMLSIKAADMDFLLLILICGQIVQTRERMSYGNE